MKEPNITKTIYMIQKSCPNPTHAWEIQRSVPQPLFAV